MNDKKHYRTLAIFDISIICFLIACLIFFNVNIKEFLLGNMISELIGICTEILVVVFIFEYWQNKKEHAKEIMNEKRLREYFIFFLKHGLKNLSKDLEIGNFYGADHKKNSAEIKKIVEYLKNNELKKELLNEIRQHLLIDKTAFENLLEVASHLSDTHFKAWIRITYFINQLSFTHDYKEIQSIIIDILQNINRFDEASYSSNIYVGAKL